MLRNFFLAVALLASVFTGAYPAHGASATAAPVAAAKSHHAH